MGTPETETALSSPLFTTTKPYCFTFWFDLTVCFIKKKHILNYTYENFQHSDGIHSLKIAVVKDDQETIIWEYVALLDFWEQGRVSLDPNTDFKVVIAMFFLFSLLFIIFRYQ